MKENAPANRAKLISDYNLAVDKRILVCSPPKNDFNVRKAADFNGYEELLLSWLNVLVDLRSFNVLMSIHPQIMRRYGSNSSFSLLLQVLIR